PIEDRLRTRLPHLMTAIDEAYRWASTESVGQIDVTSTKIKALKNGRANPSADSMATPSSMGQSTRMLRPQLRHDEDRICAPSLCGKFGHGAKASRCFRHQPLSDPS